MTLPVTKPTHIKFYQLIGLNASNKFQMVSCPDGFGTGLWPTLDLAQQQQLIEKIKTPTMQYEIYEIDWPTGEKGSL